MINALPFLLVAALGGSNLAYVGNAPVNVASCAITNNYDTLGGADAEMSVLHNSFLSIGFTNTANKTVSAVTFDVIDDGNGSREIKDAGMFSPGVTINHEYNYASGGADNATCTVRAVAFTDGSSWQQ